MRVIFHRGWFRSSVGVTGNPGYSTTERHPYRSEGNSMYASDDKKFHIQKFFLQIVSAGHLGPPTSISYRDRADILQPVCKKSGSVSIIGKSERIACNGGVVFSI